MSCCSQSGLLPFNQAVSLISQQLSSIIETETIDVNDALDRVLAEAILAPISVPSSDNSAMDGYAIRASDVSSTHKTFKVIGQSLAGHSFIFPKEESALNEYEAVRIMTGATIPEGADAVVMQESTSCQQEQLIIHTSVFVGDNIRRTGEDIPHNSEVINKGHRITALDIGLLASLGIVKILVYRKLRIALISTGDELLAAGQAAVIGKIYDCNRPLLKALLQRLNINTQDFGIILDNINSLRIVFRNASEWADVIISTGGVSVGDADYTKDVLEELGDINFWKVAIKPGKPFAFGRLGKSWFFGLPGNPVSTAVTYHQLVVPGLRQLAGEVDHAPIRITAITKNALKKQSGRVDFQRGIFIQEQGVNYVCSTGSQSSAVLSSMTKANCYICLEAERGSVELGETVTIIPFDETIR
jgi:molybdopterin molybdotransferase